jgi:hypothetical protein
MEDVCSSETFVDFGQNMWCYIPENNTLQNWRNFKKNLAWSASRYNIRIHMIIQGVATKGLSRSSWCCGRHPNWVPLCCSNGVEATYPAEHMARMLPRVAPEQR